MKYLIISILLGLLLLTTSCSAPTVQSEEPQDGQYYTWEYVLNRVEATVIFYAPDNAVRFYATEFRYTIGGCILVQKYFTHHYGRLSERCYLYSEETRILGSNWELRELE